MIIHYIWIGDSAIPENFQTNLDNTIKRNNRHNFEIWTEPRLKKYIHKYLEIYESSSLFHKLQLAKYCILDHFGGLYSDFDIEWYKDFDYVKEIIENNDLALIKRESIYFFNRGMKKTNLLDDYVFFSNPGLTDDFLQFCLNRSEQKGDKTEPFSVYALTEWCFNKESVKYFDSSQIYDRKDCTIAYHDNKRTWNSQ